jgi:hypothetical protein
MTCPADEWYRSAEERSEDALIQMERDHADLVRIKKARGDYFEPTLLERAAAGIARWVYRVFRRG